MSGDEAEFIRWVASHANERGHNRYSQDEKAAFTAGYKAGQVAALTSAADYIEAEGDDFSDVSPALADWLRGRAVEIAGEDE